MKIKGILEGGKIVVIDKKGMHSLHGKGFGELKKEKLILCLVEGAFLVWKKRLEVSHEGKKLDFLGLYNLACSADNKFSSKYKVFVDLKERGYRVKCEESCFRICLKNTGKECPVFVYEEREDFLMRDILSFIENSEGEIALALVDEDMEVTYYIISRIHPEGTEKREFEKIKGRTIDNFVYVEDKRIFEEGFFGMPFASGVILAPIEALYLGEKGFLEISRNGKVVSKKEMLEMFENLSTERYRVYRDLRDKGLVVRTGFKFGSQFRVYKGNPHLRHSDYLMDVIEKDFKSAWSEVSGKIRLAHSVKKTYVFAVVEPEKIEYISFSRFLP